MTNDTCDYPTPNGECQNPATEGNSCWIESHGGYASGHGRPKALADEQTRQRILVAVGQGLKIEHQAGLAGISPKTLRRGLCCVETPRNPSLEADPCDFCRNYAQAHANGAREVLTDCRPEFVASASYGYVKEEKRDVDMDADVTAEGFEIIYGDDQD